MGEQELLTEEKQKEDSGHCLIQSKKSYMVMYTNKKTQIISELCKVMCENVQRVRKSKE